MQRLVTIPEGMPSVLVHERLMRVPYLTGAIPVPEEGSVLPNTYTYRRGETRAAVLGRMQRAMRSELARLWARRRPGIAVATARARRSSSPRSSRRRPASRPSGGWSPASIRNRLRRGMPLQADPTVIYPVTRGRPLGRRIRRSELSADNGYNTYARGGPAGRADRQSRPRLDRGGARSGADQRALFFVADGTGGHVFADTLAAAQRQRRALVRHPPRPRRDVIC